MSNLSKFGVQIAGSGGMLEPKRTNRFRVILYGFGIQGSSAIKFEQNVVKCSRPSVTFDVVEIHSYNSRMKLEGKPNWADINLSVRDDITNGAASLVGQQMQKQFNHLEQTSAIAGNDYKFRMEIHALDGSHGSSLEYWNIEGAWVKDVKYTEGVYDKADQQTIDLVISVDNCTHILGDNENVITSGGEIFPNVGPAAGNLGGATTGFSGA